MQSGSSLFDHIMASDRLTQLQDAVNTQAENFCNSVGILQQYAASGTFPEFSDIRTSMGNIGGGNAGSGTPSSTGLYGMANGIPLSLVSSANSTPLGGGGGSTPNSVTSGLNLNEVQQPLTSSSSSSTCAVTSTTGPSTSPIKLESGIRFPPTPLEDLVKQELMVDSTSSPAPTVSSTTAATATASATSSSNDNNDNNVNSSANANNNSNSTNHASTNAPTPNTPEDYGVMFARIIARTAKEIDVLIDSLPSTIEVDQSSTGSAAAASSGNNSNSNSTSAADQFNSSIRRLEQENVESAAQLEETIRQGEAMLERIQNALAEIAQCQLKSAALDC